MSDPERWLVSSEAPPELRELLRRARSDFPPPEAVASVGSRLGLTTKGAATVSLLGKGAFVLAALSLGAASTYWLSTDGEPSQSEVMRSIETAPAVASPVPEPSPKVGGPERVRDEPTDGSSELPYTSKDQVKSERAAQKAQAPLPREVDLIREARQKMDTDPEAALRKLREHEKLFPRGVLAEEREVLRVRALARSGQTKAAREKAAQFEKLHPNSAHQLER